jgi:hypothetical protein
MTRAMADAGVNVRGVSAAVVGNKFVAYIGLDSEADADRAMRALKGVKAGGGGARKAPRRGKRTAGTAKRAKTSRSRR